MRTKNSAPRFLLLPIVALLAGPACSGDDVSQVVPGGPGTPGDDTGGGGGGSDAGGGGTGEDTGGGTDTTVDPPPDRCEGDSAEGCPCLPGQTRTCYDGPAGTRDVGTCSSGFQVCTDGLWGPCEGSLGPIGPVEVLCDGADENCNGMIDEGLRNACGGCGEVPPEDCGPQGWGNGLDDNCDGQVDEGCDCDERTNTPCYPGSPLDMGRGICRGGVMDCGPDGAWGACLGAILPQPEICNGIDDNCNGFVDEGLRNACGDCAGAEPQEICNGIDDNCNGNIDEGVRLPCGLCPDEVGEEICGNGLDDNCNGLVDENCSCRLGEPTCYPGPADRIGIGQCTQGSRACDATGEFWGACTGFVLPGIEVCDGVDNSCDGLVDIDARGCSVCFLAPEICNGIDDNCNGFIDEGLRNACGDCFEDVVPERLLGPEFCNGLDDDCNGLIDEGLLNACGTCGDSCYVRTWESADDWRGGELEGIDDDALGEGLRLGQARFSFPDLWIANSQDNTVTRINTNDPVSVVGTYGVGLSPSRTAVDFNGDVWVANRAFNAQGTVTKIASEGCTGAECVLFQVNIGANNALPRGLAIDRDGFAWVGTFNGNRLYRLHPDDGRIVQEVDTGLNIYGLAIDTEGIIWIATIGNQGIGAFDTTTNTLIGNWRPSGCSAPYGIAVDGDGNVWFGNWSCQNVGRLNRDRFNARDFDVSRLFTMLTPGGNFRDNRGAAVDGDGAIYFTSSRDNRLAKYIPRESRFEWTVTTCSRPIGVGIANDGNIWVNCFDSNNAQRFQPDGTSLGTIAVGRQPYSYSDMTGFQLRNFTAPRGLWRGTFDCGRPSCGFDELVWTAILPPGTGASARARTSLDNATWSAWSTSAAASPANIRDLPAGRYCQVELTLTTNQNEITPTVTDVQVFWQRP
jgi:streptogramin lyase